MTANCPVCSVVMTSIGGDRKNQWWFRCQQNGHGYFSIPTAKLFLRQIAYNRMVAKYQKRREEDQKRRKRR